MASRMENRGRKALPRLSNLNLWMLAYCGEAYRVYYTTDLDGLQSAQPGRDAFSI